jgi:hypothetical protein
MATRIDAATKPIFHEERGSDPDRFECLSRSESISPVMPRSRSAPELACATLLPMAHCASCVQLAQCAGRFRHQCRNCTNEVRPRSRLPRLGVEPAAAQSATCMRAWAKKGEVRSSIAPLLVRSPEDVPSCLLQRTSGEMTQEHAQRSFNRFAEQSVDRKAADRRGLPNNVRYADVGFPSRPCFRSVALSRNARPDGSSPSIVRARN